MRSAKPLILVLESDPASAEALSLILSDWGAEIVHATNADQIIGAVGNRLRDLRFIISDRTLGSGADGETMMQHLIQAAPRVRILVLSSSFRDPPSDNATGVGFDVMQKPVHADALLAWLDKC